MARDGGLMLGLRGVFEAPPARQEYEVEEVVGRRHEVLVDRARSAQECRPAGVLGGGSGFGGCEWPLWGRRLC